MGIRESIVAALLSSHLEPHLEREAAIDRVAALARASKLGRLLWHWKYAGQDRYGGPAFNEFLVKARRATGIRPAYRDYKVLQRACKLALMEWHDPGCQTCKGAGEIKEENLLIVCETCGGGKVRRFTDEERIGELGVDRERYKQFWEAQLRLLFGILCRADPETARTVRSQLRDD